MDLVCVLDFYGKKEYYFSPESREDFSVISELEERILSEFYPVISMHKPSGVFKFEDDDTESFFLLKYANCSEIKMRVVKSVIGRLKENK